MDGFARRLLAWFDLHGRKDLPWHRQPEPYRIWLSEIMLQQTQVATVIPYYERFTERFPDVASLADASIDEVLQYWSGLGYYARARNLHRAARQIAGEHQGRFPREQQALEALPGIGRSTAGAIRAQAFHERAAILDGNVKRVLARYHAIDGWPGQARTLHALWERAEQHTPDERVRDYTQAIMDLGSLVCTRSRPACDQCPVADGCVARAEQAQQAYPGKKPRKTLPEKACWMLLIQDDRQRLLLERRPPTGIWGGLWSLPEADAGLAPEALPRYCQASLGLECSQPRPATPFSHTFSHYRLNIRPVFLKAGKAKGVAESAALDWQAPDSALNLGLPAPVKRLLSELHQTG